MPHDAAHCFHIKMLREKEGLIPVWRYHRMARTSECRAGGSAERTRFYLDESSVARRCSKLHRHRDSMTAASSSVLTQPLLDRCRARAPGYDRDNTFCLQDFNELKAAGYLKMALPKEFGGPGMTLAQV